MANDIFSRNVSELAGVFTADRAKLTLPDNLGVLVQNMQFQYAQTVTRLYEVGANGPNDSSNIYYVGGRTQGNMAVNRVIGPAGTICAMYTRFGDVCRASENSISLTLTEVDCRPNAGSSSSTTFTMKNCVITAVGISVAAQDMVINENTTMMFSSLEARGPGCASGENTNPVIIGALPAAA